MILQETVDILSKIPTPIIVGLITITGALAGVIVSNISNTNRLKNQLKHDSAERAKERQSKLRQEVYLQTAEEIGKANLLMGSLAAIDIREINPIDKLQGLLTAVSKAQLVAEPETAAILQQLAACYGTATMRLMKAARPASDSKIKIDIAQEFSDKSFAEAERYLSIMNDLTESGGFDLNAHNALKNKLNFHDKQAQKYANKVQEGYTELLKNQEEFNKQLILEMKQISDIGISSIAAIRADLGMRVDIAILKELSDKQWREMEKELDSVMSFINEARKSQNN